jgi:hypothetical protein
MANGSLRLAEGLGKLGCRRRPVAQEAEDPPAGRVGDGEELLLGAQLADIIERIVGNCRTFGDCRTLAPL